MELSPAVRSSQPLAQLGQILVWAGPNNSSKPTPLRSGKSLAEKACQSFASTTHRGLTQVLAAMGNPSKLVAGLFALLSSSGAAASDFEYCELAGTVQSAELQPGPRARVFKLRLVLTAAQGQSGANGEDSYTDCKDRIGKELQVKLQLPRRYGKPQSGDRIRVNWSAVDGFSASGGYAGTSATTELLEYSPAGNSAGS